MVLRRILQSPGMGTCLALFWVWVVGAGACITDALINPEPDLRHRDVIGSAMMVVVFLMFGWCLMILNNSATWIIRLLWTLGLVTLIVHMVLAFWLAHGWSHSAAVEHVREVGGFGGGIVVNYLFAMVWLADVVWWWIDPLSRANRPRWVDWSIHGFLAFVVINATVIFGSPERRLFYGAMFFVLAILELSRRVGFMKSR